jgi:WD40 repeat protein
MELRLISTLSGHEEDRVWHVSWSLDGKFLASCGEDKIIRIWMVQTNKAVGTTSAYCISTLEDGQQRTIRSCEWSKDGRMIASASFDGVEFFKNR